MSSGDDQSPTATARRRLEDLASRLVQPAFKIEFVQHIAGLLLQGRLTVKEYSSELAVEVTTLAGSAVPLTMSE